MHYKVFDFTHLCKGTENTIIQKWRGLAQYFFLYVINMVSFFWVIQSIASSVGLCSYYIKFSAVHSLCPLPKWCTDEFNLPWLYCQHIASSPISKVVICNCIGFQIVYNEWSLLLQYAATHKVMSDFLIYCIMTSYGKMIPFKNVCQWESYSIQVVAEWWELIQHYSMALMDRDRLIRRKMNHFVVWCKPQLTSGALAVSQCYYAAKLTKTLYFDLFIILILYCCLPFHVLHL